MQMGSARYTSTSLRTVKKLSASWWTQRFVSAIALLCLCAGLSAHIVLLPFIHSSHTPYPPVDRLPSGVQCSGDAPSPPKPARDDLARRSGIASHSQRKASLRRTNALRIHFFPNQNQKDRQSSQLANARTTSPTRSLQDR